MNKKLRNICIGGIAIIALFSSCKNFLQGKDFLQELESVIEYQNANSVTVYVSSTDGSGSFVLGNGEKSLKPGDSFDLEFKVNSNYEFRKWIAVDKDDQTKNLSSYVQFSPKNEAKTKVTLVEECQNILIMPLCQERPRILIDQITPAYDRDGIPFNSTIKLPVSNYLKTTLEESNLTLSITSTIGDIKDYFHKPIIDGGNTIKLRPNPEKYDDILSLLTNGKATITITIPAGWIDNDDIECTSETVYSYVINNTITSNNESVDVTFEVDEAVGELSVFGTNKIYVDTTYKITATISQDYIFDHWGVFYKGSDQEIANARNIIHFAQDNGKDLSSTTFKLYYSVENLVIKPICFQTPKIVKTLPENITNGVERNTAIEITFDREIDVNSFRFSSEELSGISFYQTLSTPNGDVYGYISKDGKYVWKNIEIVSSENENLLMFFSNPDFYDKKVLKIIANDEVPEGTTINVRVNKEFYYTITSNSGNEVKVKGSAKNEFFEFSYKVNTSLKERLPEFSFFNIAGAKSFVNQENIDKCYAVGTTTWLEKNRCGNTIYYYMNIFDETINNKNPNSELYIDRKFLYNAGGVLQNEPSVQTKISLTRTEEDKPYTTVYNGQIDMSDRVPGIYQFDFYVKSADRKYLSAKKSYLICHVNGNGFDKISVYNEGYNKNNSSQTVFKENEINEKVNNFHVLLDKDYLNYVYQTYNGENYKISNTVNEFNTYVKYGWNSITSDYKASTTFTFDKEENNKYAFSFTAPPDLFVSTTGTNIPIEVVFEDECGIQYMQKREVPLFSITSNTSSDNDFIQFTTNGDLPETESACFYNVWYYENTSFNKYELTQTSYYPHAVISGADGSNTYTIVVQKCFTTSNSFDETNAIYGKTQSKTSKITDWDGVGPNIQITQCNSNLTQNSNKVCLKFKWKAYSSNGDKYDTITKTIYDKQKYYNKGRDGTSFASYREEQTYENFINGCNYEIPLHEIEYYDYESDFLLFDGNKTDDVNSEGYEQELVVVCRDGSNTVKYTKTINYKVDVNNDTFAPVVEYTPGQFNNYADMCNLQYKKAPITVKDDCWYGSDEKVPITVYYSTSPNLKTVQEIENCDSKVGYIKGNEIWVDVKDANLYGYAYTIIEDASKLKNYTFVALGEIHDETNVESNVAGAFADTEKNCFVSFSNRPAYTSGNEWAYTAHVMSIFDEGEWKELQVDTREYWEGNRGSRYYKYKKWYDPVSVGEYNKEFIKVTYAPVNEENYLHLGAYEYYYYDKGTSIIYPIENPTLETSDFVLENSSAYRILRDNDKTKPTFVHIMYSKTNYDEKYGEDSIKYWERFGTETSPIQISEDVTILKNTIPSGYYYKLIGHCSNGFTYSSDVGFKK